MNFLQKIMVIISIIEKKPSFLFLKPLRIAPRSGICGPFPPGAIGTIMGV